MLSLFKPQKIVSKSTQNPTIIKVHFSDAALREVLVNAIAELADITDADEQHIRIKLKGSFVFLLESLKRDPIMDHMTLRYHRWRHYFAAEQIPLKLLECTGLIFEYEVQPEPISVVTF